LSDLGPEEAFRNALERAIVKAVAVEVASIPLTYPPPPPPPKKTHPLRIYG
jgi:hypothetical protein